jgi:hypothetical protein
MEQQSKILAISGLFQHKKMEWEIKENQEDQYHYCPIRDYHLIEKNYVDEFKIKINIK